MFGELLQREDWTELYMDATTSTDMVCKLHKKFATRMDICFPYKRVRKRANEDPWITAAIRKKIRISLRERKRETMRHISELQRTLVLRAERCPGQWIRCSLVCPKLMWQKK